LPTKTIAFIAIAPFAARANLKAKRLVVVLPFLALAKIIYSRSFKAIQRLLRELNAI
jgi:hypothetical protein